MNTTHHRANFRVARQLARAQELGYKELRNISNEHKPYVIFGHKQRVVETPAEAQ